jgi:hypothetical protein
LADPVQQKSIKAVQVAEIDAENKKIFLAIFLAVKEVFFCPFLRTNTNLKLIAEFETQKMASDTVKEVLETTTYDINFLTSEVCFSFPRV